MSRRGATSLSTAAHPYPLRRRGTNPRRLYFEALEARQLLSASPNPPPVETYYLPLRTADLYQAMHTINARAVAPISTYASIAIAEDGTRIYYDQWENGFVSDIANPTPSEVYNAVTNPGGVQIWGDGNPANGSAPGHPDDVLKAGDVITLASPSITLPRNSSQIFFDGGDKIAASKSISVGQTGWASGTGTLLAEGLDVFATSTWGTQYKVPVGQNTTAGNHMFDYTGLSIMAAKDGTTVKIDKDGNGTVDVTVTLNQGQSYLVNNGVKQGATVISTDPNKPIQVDLITGTPSQTYASRWFALVSSDQWSSSYYTPVSTRSTNATTVFLYNPATTALSVTEETRGAGGTATTLTDTTISVPAKGTAKVTLLDGSGTHFFTPGGQPFYALSTTDYGSFNYDWGMSLIPQSQLTTQAIVGLGLGRDPTSNILPNANGSPVWVTPVGNGDTPVTVYVDYHGDDSGPLTDPNGFHYDIALSLKELQSAKVFDPAGNQSGMLLYTLDPNVKLVTAWGEDPSSIVVGEPGLDAGTSVAPLPEFDAGKSATLLVDANGDGVISPGDTLLYTIAVNDVSRATVADLNLTDNLPSTLTYLPNTTHYTITTHDGTTSAPVSVSDGGVTAFPLDEGGLTLPALAGGASFTLTFEARIAATLPAGVGLVINKGAVKSTALNETVPLEADTPVLFDIQGLVFNDRNDNGILDSFDRGLPGVMVDLLNGTTVVATASTDTTGHYLFVGQTLGNYTVNVVNSSLQAVLPGAVQTVGINPSPVAVVGGGPITDAGIDGYYTFNVGVEPVPPVAVNDSSLHNPPGPVTLNVTANDTDVNGDLLPSTVDLNPAVPGQQTTFVVAGQGTWSVDPLGDVTFTPMAGFTHDPTPITYTVSDQTGLVSNAATVTIDYVPVATPDNSTGNTTGLAVTVDVLANDTTGDAVVPSTVQIVGVVGSANPAAAGAPGAGRSLMVAGQGTWTVNATTGAITFTPLAGYTGDPSPIAYTVQDAQGNVSNAATVTVDYNQFPPVAVNDSSLHNSAGPVTLNVTANDTDANGDLAPSTVDLNPALPGQQTKLVAAGQGSWSVDSLGNVTFTPLAGFTHDPTPITYTVSDRTGLVSNAATITIDYVPVATPDNSTGNTTGLAVVVDVLANDTTGDTVVPGTVQIVGTPAVGSPLTVANQGTWSVNATTGAITFTPLVGFMGDPTPIAYTVQDAQENVSNAATVTVKYIPLPPAIAITKNGPVFAVAGSALTFRYTVTDPSPVPLSNVTVMDNKAGAAHYVSGDANNNGRLDPGETWTFAATYTPAFTASSPLTNIATAAGAYAGQTATATASYTLNPFILNKDLYLYYTTSTSTGGSSSCGTGSPSNYNVHYGVKDTTPFTVQVSKSGTVVGQVQISEAAPLDLWLSNGNYTFSEINLSQGYIPVTGSITYTTGQGSNNQTMINVPTFDLAVVKSGPATATPGQHITYNFTVTNTGPAAVKPVLTDILTGPPTYISGDTNHDGLLEAGETWTFTSPYTIPTSTSTCTTRCGSAPQCGGGSQVPQTITNTVTVDAAENPHAPAGVILVGGDTTPANNTSKWTVTVLQPTPLAKAMTATIGFWHNNNGQQLINSLNGGSSSTALGNWLAASFPHMYGALAGNNNLAGDTNSQIASFYLSQFNITGQKLNAQYLAVALAVYSTNTTLAGGTYAALYGFIINATGTGAATYNVGSNGQAFGLPNNTSATVLSLLLAADARAVKGVLYNGNTLLRNMANTVFDGINSRGDIS